MNRYPEIVSRFEEIGKNLAAELRQHRDADSFPEKAWRYIASIGIFEFEKDANNGLAEGLFKLGQALRGLTYGSMEGGLAASIISHAGLSVQLLERFAPPVIREHYLDDLKTGRKIAAFAITERTGGSDATKVATNLKCRGEYFELTGAKWHITNAPIADVIVTFARDITSNKMHAIVLDAQQSGIEISPPLSPAGLGTSPVASIKFNAVHVSDEQFLDGDLGGERILREAFLAERLLVPFVALGHLRRLIRASVHYTQGRRVFGEALASYQYIQKKLTDMQVNYSLVDALLEKTFERLANGEDISLEASILKMYSMKTLLEHNIDAVQLFGSYGIQKGSMLTESLLDNLAASIAGGTEEVHRKVIFQSMLLRNRR